MTQLLPGISKCLAWTSLFFCFAIHKVRAQAPNISYPSTPKTYSLGTPISPWTPTNTGGAVSGNGQYFVSSLAGKGWDNDGIGSAASFKYPSGVAVDASGNIYVADYNNNKIRKVSAAGVVTTFAGTGAQGSKDGTAASASFYYPKGVAVDAVGNVYVADWGNNKIRKVSPAGVVSTLAGTGLKGVADGIGDSANFYNPIGVAVDTAGNVYVADEVNNIIRKVSATGVVTTVAGDGEQGSTDGAGLSASFNNPKGVAVDIAGNVYIADAGNNKIRKLSTAGVVSTLAGSGIQGSADGTSTVASFDFPTGLTVDASGNVYVADRVNNKIRKVSTAGVVTTLAGNGVQGNADGISNVASFYSPEGVSVDPAGNVYVVDSYNHKIRKVSSAGVVTTLAGSGATGSSDGAGSAASFSAPFGIALDKTGNMFVADMLNHKIRRVSTAGVVTTFAGSGAFGSADGGAATASFYYPKGIAVDAAGNVYVADQTNHKIRKVSAAGVVTTLAGNGTSGSSDGVGASASFQNPSGIAVDLSGNVYVADYDNHKIRKINATGVVTTLAGNGVRGDIDGTGNDASFRYPSSVAVDSSGNVFVADSYNHKIRKISAAGVVTTIAGNGNFGSTDSIGSAATFNYPFGVALDALGNVYVADQLNLKIRKISTTGVVTTLAGNGAFGNVDGVDSLASFNNPVGLAADLSGNVFVADVANDEIRKISPAGKYTISPTLPKGLVFDTATGTISGTPNVVSPLTTYTISATNLSGISTYQIQFSVENPLPVKLSAFSATLLEKTVKVQWQTSTEANTNYFNVQRSSDGKTFTTIGRISAKGNSTNTSTYHFTDLTAFGEKTNTLFYRLQTMDKSGSYEYSELVAVRLMDNSTNITLHPNPAKEKLSLQFTSGLAEKAMLQLSNSASQTLQTKNVQLTKGKNALDVNIVNLPKGSYLLVLTTESNKWTGRFVKE